MERPICGPASSDGSGSDSGGGSDFLGGGSNSLGGGSNGDGSEAEDESHQCGCSSDSDCFDLEATLPDNLTAICEGNVCVEGCRFGVKIGIGLQITCFQGGHLLLGLERDVLKLKCEHVQLL